MHKVFSTVGLRPHETFSAWRDVLGREFVPAEQTRLGTTPFRGSVEVTSMGGVHIGRVNSDAMRTEYTDASLRRHNKHDTIGLFVMLRGVQANHQYDRESLLKVGDVAVLDTNRPSTLMHGVPGTAIIIEAPRKRLENILGPARLFSSLTSSEASASARLAAMFITELLEVEAALTDESRNRMILIGIDLVAAALSDRLARETPRAIQGDVLVQRAKSFIMSNLDDGDIDPETVAASLGISLRHLQQLFRIRGRSIAAWMWEQRLDKAAEILSDPARRNLPISFVAVSCGFTNQGHFSSRFKERFQISPRQYRDRQMSMMPDGDPYP